MGKVVKMPAASRPRQISSLMPKSRNGTAWVSPPPVMSPGASFPDPALGRAVTDPGSEASGSVVSPLII